MNRSYNTISSWDFFLLMTCFISLVLLLMEKTLKADSSSRMLLHCQGLRCDGSTLKTYKTNCALACCFVSRGPFCLPLARVCPYHTESDGIGHLAFLFNHGPPLSFLRTFLSSPLLMQKRFPYNTF